MSAFNKRLFYSIVRFKFPPDLLTSVESTRCQPGLNQ